MVTVSQSQTRNGLKDPVYLRFWPTEGRLCMLSIPTDFTVAELPIPECRSIFGVPMVPAERTISFFAVKLNFLPK